MTQPDDKDRAQAEQRLVMDYPVTLDRLPDALQDQTSDETE